MKTNVFSKVAKNLYDQGYIVTCFDTVLEAADYIDSQIDNQTIGFGGSMTLEQMGLYERLALTILIALLYNDSKYKEKRR